MLSTTVSRIKVFAERLLILGCFSTLIVGCGSLATTDMNSKQAPQLQTDTIRQSVIAYQARDLETRLGLLCPRVGLFTVFSIESSTDENLIIGCQTDRNASTAMMFELRGDRLRAMWDTTLEEQATQLLSYLKQQNL